MGVLVHFYLVLFRDNRSLRFWCVDFGWRTFLLQKYAESRELWIKLLKNFTSYT